MSPTIILSIVVITLLLINLTRKWKSWRQQDPLSQFRGPFRLPIMGHVYTPTRWSPKKVFNELITHWFLKYQSPSILYLIFRQPFVLVYDPENVQILSNKALEKGSDYKKIVRYYGNGIGTDNNHERRRNRRKLLRPSFSVKVMGSYYLKEYRRLNEHFVSEFEVHADSGHEFDLWTTVQHNNCRINLATYLEYNENDLKDVDIPKFGLAVTNGLKHLRNSFFFPWLFLEVGSSLSAWIDGNKERYFRDFDEFGTKIHEKLEARTNNTEDCDSTEGEEVSGAKKTFVETIYSKRGFELYSPEDVMGEILTIFMRQIWELPCTVCFTLLMLAMHEDSQQKVFEEISSVLRDSEDTITMEVFDRLTYLDQCIKETLRLFPSVPWISRRTTNEVILKDGRVVPSGCDVLLAIIGVHRDPSVYEDPTKWMPDRFLPDQVAKRHPYSFMPAGVGARKCVGFDTAFLSVKCQIVSFIQRYKLTTDMKLSDIDLTFDTLLRNDAGFRVYIQKRNSR